LHRNPRIDNLRVSPGYNAGVRDFEAISVLGSGAITLLASLAFVARLLPAPLAKPNARSLHTVPVPRIGGVAIWAGWGLACVASEAPAWWLLPIGAVLCISLADDWRALPARIRLGVQAIAGLGVAIAYGDAHNAAAWPVIAFNALVIVWMANLYNFMDGADGLAAGMGVLGFGTYAAIAVQAGADALSIQCAGLAAACLGFLVFNWPPARLFMGDVGSVGLGFVAALLGLHGYAAGVWGFWLPPLAFAPFIVDATITVVRRWRQGERLAQAHRDHAYQHRIMIEGDHRGTLRVYLAWMVLCAVTAIAAARWLPEAGPLLLVVVCVAFGGYCRAIDRRWAARAGTTHAG
jgi:UDP-N-acetylmuramyl pentapeptide phosphotransferase/UDP-N-acetylglucosamine-1-phosphate transferase